MMKIDFDHFFCDFIILSHIIKQYQTKMNLHFNKNKNYEKNSINSITRKKTVYKLSFINKWYILIADTQKSENMRSDIILSE